MTGETMDADLAEEIEYLTCLLSKSGFFSTEEIIEILEDQFMDEEIDFSRFEIFPADSSNLNFSRLENAFEKLSREDIVAVHNCGYDIAEGVSDVFELNVHLLNNKFKAEGFCFYTFEDVEYAIFDGRLKITFAGFDDDENKALDIGRTVSEYLKAEGLNVKWDGTVNSQIELNPFTWDKSYEDKKEYEIEGAYEVYTTGV